MASRHSGFTGSPVMKVALILRIIVLFFGAFVVLLVGINESYKDTFPFPYKIAGLSDLGLFLIAWGGMMFILALYFIRRFRRAVERYERNHLTTI
jgi:hypothetical protein